MEKEMANCFGFFWPLLVLKVFQMLNLHMSGLFLCPADLFCFSETQLQDDAATSVFIKWTQSMCFPQLIVFVHWQNINSTSCLEL